MLPAFALSLITSTTYEVVADETTLFVQVYKDPTTLLAGMSHDHVVRAKSVAGTVIVDATSCAAVIEVPVADLEPDEPWLRKRLKLSGELDESDRAKVKRNMLARDQLHSARFPLVVVEITDCKVVGDSERVNLTGTLRIRGETQPLFVLADVSEQDGRLRVRGSFTAHHTDFGFSPYSAGLGTLKNRNAMTFVLDVVARRR